MEKIEQIKPERKMKHTPTPDELKKLFKAFEQQVSMKHDYYEGTILPGDWE